MKEDIEKMDIWLNRKDEYRHLDKWYFGLTKQKREALETAVKKNTLKKRLVYKFESIEDKQGM